MQSPEWLIEEGIGEARAALVENGEIIEARIELEDALPAQSIISARLTDCGMSGRNAIATSEGGAEYLLPRGAAGVNLGAQLTIEVTRQTIPGSEPWKRPLAQLTDKPPGRISPLAERLGGRRLVFPDGRDEFGNAGWNDLLEQARTGLVTFSGGELRITPTAAMTLIDVDGYLPPEKLAILGAGEAAKAIRRLDIGGSIGIDLPTSGSRAARQASAAAIDRLVPQPFERTGVNGFGFVQVVRPRSRASLIELAQDYARFEARALLRRTAFDTPGTKTLVAHPAVIGILEQQQDWLDALSRQLGGKICLRAKAALPIFGGHAETA